MHVSLAAGMQDLTMHVNVVIWRYYCCIHIEGRGSAVVSTSACHAGGLALYIRDCVSLCLSDETLKAVGPFYLVSMPGEVKDPTSLHWKCVTCRGLHNTTL